MTWGEGRDEDDDAGARGADRDRAAAEPGARSHVRGLHHASRGATRRRHPRFRRGRRALRIAPMPLPRCGQQLATAPAAGTSTAAGCDAAIVQSPVDRAAPALQLSEVSEHQGAHVGGDREGLAAHPRAQSTRCWFASDSTPVPPSGGTDCLRRADFRPGRTKTEMSTRPPSGAAAPTAARRAWCGASTRSAGWLT